MAMETTELLRLVASAKDGYEKYKGIFERINNDFLGKMDAAVKRDLGRREKSAIFIPVTGGKVRRILASFQEAYFSNEDIVKIGQSLEGNAPAAVVETLQTAFNFYIRNKTKPFFALTKNMLGAILTGTPIAKVYWAGDAPIVENISVFECWLDPEAQGYGDIKYLVHNIKIARNDIVRLRDSGVFDGELGFNPDDEPYKRESVQEVYYQDAAGGWNVATLLKQSKLRDVPLSDGLPFIVGALLPQQHNEDTDDTVKAYGDSPTSILMPLQQEINVRRNQQIDAISLYLNPRILVQSGSMIDPNQLKKGAGQIIYCEGIDGVKFMPMPPVQESIFDVNRLDLEAQEALGITNYNSGVSTNNLNQTATGISVLSSEANMRIQSLIRAYNETFIEPLMARVARLIYKYDPLYMGNFALRPPLDIVATINTGIGATNPQTQAQNLDKAFAMFLQVQHLQGAMAVIEEMLPLLGIKNKEKFIQPQMMPPQPAMPQAQGLMANPSIT